VNERLKRVLVFLNTALDMLKLSDKIRSNVKEEMSKTQREYYLREQLKAIRKELGDDEVNESDDLEKQIESAGMPEEVLKTAKKELKRLRSTNNNSAEAGVIRNYIEWLIDVPWKAHTEDKLDLVLAEQILNEDHHGLDKVKRRILEHLAVAKLRANLKGSILCLVGPPGVGKTSLGKSIARAMNRNFVRISLGGVRDEAEIRGHRRTYIGAMPGKIIASIKKAKTVNPVMVLDEIDKLGNDWRGDPSSALLEVLDPEQNNTFVDHYLDVPYDLSKVFFICTANVVDSIPPPLRDRLEIIEIRGYTEAEKRDIARKYLLPQAMESTGLKGEKSAYNVQITDDAIAEVIHAYTRESGVRNLKRELESLLRSVAHKVSKEETKEFVIDAKVARDILGPARYIADKAQKKARPGVVTGMAWTPVGGDILFIESTAMPGKGSLKITGQLGDVMKESAEAALSYIRSHARMLKLDPALFEKTDIHLHVPAGGIPKDGPSAGVTMLMSLISLLTNKPVNHDIAMTGEITLRGSVLPVGGIKEKVLAAHRAGIKTVFLPSENQKDLDDIPKEVQKELSIEWVDSAANLIQKALSLDVTADDLEPLSDLIFTQPIGDSKDTPKPVH
jgi:ATP-dependent Lon protease